MQHASQHSLTYLGRYARVLLYAGAILMTCTIVLFAYLDVRTRTTYFMEKQWVLMADQINQAQIHINKMSSRISQMVELHEHGKLAEKKSNTAQQALLKQAQMQPGHLVQAPHLAAFPFSAFIRGDDNDGAIAMLDLLQNIAPPLQTQLKKMRVDLKGFIYRKDADFLAIFPPSPPSSENNDQALITQHIASIETTLSAYSDNELKQKRVFWLLLKDNEPDLMPYLVITIFNGNVRTGALILQIPKYYFLDLNSKFFASNDFFIVSQNRHIFDAHHLATKAPEREWHDHFLEKFSARSEPPKHGYVQRVGMIFFLVQPVAGTNWFAVYAFDWRALITAMKDEWLLLLSILLTVLLALWSGVFVFSRYVLRPLQEAIEQASHAKSMFIAVMSHEIRTPLHGAAGNLELLELDHLTPTQSARVKTIRSTFDTLLQLVNNVLDISRVEAEALKIQARSFNLQQIVGKCSATFVPLIQRKGIHFNHFISPKITAELIGDDLRLTQILMNLLGNASKFTEQGSIHLRITLTQQIEATQWLRFEIEDSGIGIATDSLASIFEPFVQQDNAITGRFGGSGLGLSLCQRLTHLMGGSIRVRSEIGHGSCVTVDLPFLATSAVTTDLTRFKNTTHVPITNIPIFQNAQQFSILVAEDDVVSRQLIEHQLQTLGFSDVQTCEDGLQALQYLTQRHFDVLLSDFNMRSINGAEVLRRLRQQDISLPVIVISASYLTKQETEGFAQVLYKPVSLTQLNTALQAALKQVAIATPATASTLTWANGDTVFIQRLQHAFQQSWEDDKAQLLQAITESRESDAAHILHHVQGALMILQQNALAERCRILQLRYRTQQEVDSTSENENNSHYHDCQALILAIDRWISKAPQPILIST